MVENMKKALAPFWDTRIGAVFLLGILSGLPWVMIGSALTLWLKEAGVSRTQIGYAGLIFGVYSINFLWAPLLDRFQFRGLRRIGPRRNWVLVCQIIIAFVCLILSGFNPLDNAKVIVLLALVIAIASATQDIAIDAFRIDAFDHNEVDKISAAAAASTAGWWTGYAGLGFFPLYLSDQNWTWAQLYPLLGITTLVFSASVFLRVATKTSDSAPYIARYNSYLNKVTAMPQLAKTWLILLLVLPPVIAVWVLFESPGAPRHIAHHSLYIPAVVLLEVGLLVAILWLLARYSRHTNLNPSPRHNFLNALPAALLANVVAPLEEFFKRNGTSLALGLLIFVVIFKLGEAFLGRMSIVFYKEIGFTNADIATYSKMFTWGITVAAAVPCALLNARMGLVKGLFLAGVFMALSNLLLAVIALVGPDLNWYLAAVIVDGITTTWGTVAFVAFISTLCSHTFSATQYALLASLGTFGRTTLAAFSGQMVDALGGNWAVFFVITTLMVIPGLLMLVLLQRRLKFALQTTP